MVVLMVVSLVGCGDDKGMSPAPITLNTAPHFESDGLGWPSTGMLSKNVQWRLISFIEARDGRSTEMKGAFNVLWANNGTGAKPVSYDLRFYDVDGFQLDTSRGHQRFLEATSTAETSGNFVLFGIPSIEIANSISEMQIWASIR